RRTRVAFALVVHREPAAPGFEGAAGLGADHVVGLDLVEEAAADGALLLAVAEAAAGVREEEGLLGPRHADVEQAALLLQLLRVLRRRREREEPLLQPGHEDRLELQPLRGDRKSVV